MHAGPLAAHIDHDPAAGNDLYATRRSSTLSLRPPTVQLLPSGTFTRFVRKCGKLGRQHKVPRVLRDRQALNELLETTHTLTAPASL